MCRLVSTHEINLDKELPSGETSGKRKAKLQCGTPEGKGMLSQNPSGGSFEELWMRIFHQ